MIETIIDVDGVAEPFDGNKLNHWVKEAVGKIGVDDWRAIAKETVADMPAVVTVNELMGSLIDRLMSRDTWSYYKMAGRLMAVQIRQQIFKSKVIPTVREVQRRLYEHGIMRALDYTDYEWAVIEKTIDHDLDLESPHYALEQVRYKYSLTDHKTKTEFETQQFVFMRMAMAIFEKSKPTDPTVNLETAEHAKRSRLENVIRIYKHFSKKRLSSPTPNYNNMGTKHRGYASCCLVASGDNRWSLSIADHITYIMTTQSAGQGLNVMCRSIGDAVQNGLFLHRGKKPYIDVFGKNINANLQGGRGGAGTFYANIYDPEARLIFGLRDTRAVDAKRNRDCHYAFMSNRYFMHKVNMEEQIFSWNIYTAPKLHQLFYSEDTAGFIAEYERLEKLDSFKKTYFDARDLLVFALTQALSTGTIYAASIDEMNLNTPFLDRIYSSNLCLEVAEPTEPYIYMPDLYSFSEIGHAKFTAQAKDGRLIAFTTRASDVLKPSFGQKWVAQDVKVGNVFWTETDGSLTVVSVESVKRESEVALCSLAAVNVTEEIVTDEEYLDIMYYAYRMIDYCILENEYVLPHMGVTARARMNAGVGMMGLATHMARKHLKYNEEAGYQELHRVAERHMYHAIKASLLIAKERGNAPWIERTKWPEGWTPRSTYRRKVDTIANFTDVYDWSIESGIAGEIIANGGLAHSVLVNFMPGESSSKALFATNSIYAMRKAVMIKIDGNNVLRWAAPYSDDENYQYDTLWNHTLIEQNSLYAIFQKHCDQAISADWNVDFRNRVTISSTELIGAEFDRVEKGVKTRYYFNVLMAESADSMKVSKSVHEVLAKKTYSEEMHAAYGYMKKNLGFVGDIVDFVLQWSLHEDKLGVFAHEQKVDLSDLRAESIRTRIVDDKAATGLQDGHAKIAATMDFQFEDPDNRESCVGCNV